MLVAYMEYQLWCVKEGCRIVPCETFLKAAVMPEALTPGYWADEPNGSYSRGW